MSCLVELIATNEDGGLRGYVSSYVNVVDACAEGDVDALANWGACYDGIDEDDLRKCWLAAAARGHLDVIIYIQDHYKEEYSKKVIEIAAQNGHLHIVMWLYNTIHRGAESCGIAVELAALRGHLHVVRWLLKQPSYSTTLRTAHAQPSYQVTNEVQTPLDSCSPIAIDLAAEGGHVDVVAFLHHEHGFRCSVDPQSGSAKAMNHAVAKNDFAMIGWLHEHGVRGDTAEAVEVAHLLDCVDAHQDLVKRYSNYLCCRGADS